MRSLYEIVIDFGAHPNQLGVLNSMQRVETSEQVDYRVGILFPQELRVMMGVRLAVAVGVGVLNAYRVLFPERFAQDSNTTSLSATTKLPGRLLFNIVHPSGLLCSPTPKGPWEHWASSSNASRCSGSTPPVGAVCCPRFKFQ